MSDFQWLGAAVICLGVGVLTLAVWGRLIARQKDRQIRHLASLIGRLERER